MVGVPQFMEQPTGLLEVEPKSAYDNIQFLAVVMS